MIPQQPALADSARILGYIDWLQAQHGLRFAGYDELWQWSTENIDAFWRSIAEHFGIVATGSLSPALEADQMPGASWFPNAQLNFAQNVFRHADTSRPALIAVDESGASETWSWARLEHETAALALFLRGQGVASGDTVAGYLPNTPHAIVAFLAASSIGAIWSACNQDVSVAAALARFAQLAPKVLIATDGVQYGGRRHDRKSEVRQLSAQLPTLIATVVAARIGQDAERTESETSWTQATARHEALSFTPLPFAHPLWVLFSSGTTGAPKGIVHSHGGVLLEQLKLLALHFDVRTGDRFFWYCSTSWVMWNVLVSGLLADATLVLYDGSPVHPDSSMLWRIAAEHRVTLLGVSPAFLQACMKESVSLDRCNLQALRSIGCTGAPIPPSCDEWVHKELQGRVPLNSTSGGTDIAGAFVSSCPLVATRPGENSVRCLGVAVEAWNAEGQPVTGEVGEMVVTRPMPSMPLYFWGDADGSRYRSSYFDSFPGRWRHGDWITVTARGSVIVHGRSDATLNRNGVRMGSAEIYQAVEALPQVREALVVGLELDGGDYWMPLFVDLHAGVQLDDTLKQQICGAIRAAASPRHVPDEIIAVGGIPHTLTGKKLEVPIKRILQGAATESVVSLGSVDRPEWLKAFESLRITHRAAGSTPHD